MKKQILAFFIALLSLSVNISGGMTSNKESNLEKDLDENSESDTEHNLKNSFYAYFDKELDKNGRRPAGGNFIGYFNAKNKKFTWISDEIRDVRENKIPNVDDITMLRKLYKTDEGYMIKKSKNDLFCGNEYYDLKGKFKYMEK